MVNNKFQYLTFFIIFKQKTNEKLDGNSTNKRSINSHIYNSHYEEKHPSTNRNGLGQDEEEIEKYYEDRNVREFGGYESDRGDGWTNQKLSKNESNKKLVNELNSLVDDVEKELLSNTRFEHSYANNTRFDQSYANDGCVDNDNYEQILPSQFHNMPIFNNSESFTTKPTQQGSLKAKLHAMKNSIDHTQKYK